MNEKSNGYEFKDHELAQWRTNSNKAGAVIERIAPTKGQGVLGEFIELGSRNH